MIPVQVPFSYLPTFRNRKSEDTFIIDLTPFPRPSPLPSATDQSWRKRKIEAPKSTSQSYMRFRSIKEIFISSRLFAERKTWKILIYILKNYFKNRNIYQLKFLKIGTSRFLEVLKVKNRDCPDKIGTVGRYSFWLKFIPLPYRVFKFVYMIPTKISSRN